VAIADPKAWYEGISMRFNPILTIIPVKAIKFRYLSLLFAVNRVLKIYIVEMAQKLAMRIPKTLELCMILYSYSIILSPS
jgi:hypothetical protein